MTANATEPIYILDIVVPDGAVLWHEESLEYESLVATAKEYLNDPAFRSKLKNIFKTEYLEFAIRKKNIDGTIEVPLFYADFISD